MTIKTLLKDAGWCWFQDPRAVISKRKLIIGGIDGQNGDVKVGIYDLKRDEVLGTVILHSQFECDDHNAPAFYIRPDGSILAVYAKHCTDQIHYYRISDPDNYLVWGEEQQFIHEYDGPKGVTYMNLFHMRKEDVLYNFFRDGVNFNPSFITSPDNGNTWGNRTHFIADELGWARPYARYIQRDADTVAVLFTDAHPRDFGNNLYYAEFREGAFYRVDGTHIKDIADGPLMPSESPCIYHGSNTKEKSPDYESIPNSSWGSSMAVDSQGYPHLAYTLYLNNNDHRYRIASWNGERWLDREVAYAGDCLYFYESSYTGLITLDPQDPDRVFISSNVNPRTGESTGEQFELYKASLKDDDNIDSINWQPLTINSEQRNIRPVVVNGEGYKVLLWLKGDYNRYTDYQTDVVGMVLEQPVGNEE